MSTGAIMAGLAAAFYIGLVVGYGRGGARLATDLVQAALTDEERDVLARVAKRAEKDARREAR